MSRHSHGQRLLMLVPLISILLLTQPDDIESLPQNSADPPAPLVEEKLDYSTLKELGASCNPLDTCSKPRKEDSLQTMNCECGERCAKYGTCCIDSPFVNDKVPNEYKEQCTPVTGTDFSVFMVNRCKTGWTGDSQVLSKCHDNAETPADPLISVPVTDQITKVTYRNRYCALCNEVENEVYPWLSPEQQNVGNSIPENLKPSVIHCRSNLISTCVPTWNDVTTKKRCESYMAAVYLTVNKTQNRSISGFHNIHCALCNFIPKGTKHSCTRRRGNQGRRAMSFSVLLDMNRSDGDVVGKTSPCKADESFDPFFKKCRKQKCSIKGYIVKLNKCVPPPFRIPTCPLNEYFDFFHNKCKNLYCSLPGLFLKNERCVSAT